jgi:multidrug efflux pump subunit AcrA (membrane-fusion protein)
MVGIMRHAVILLVCASVLVAAPGAGEGSTATAWKGTVSRTLERDGTLVPAGAAEISIWLESYRGEMIVMEAKEPGTMVNKGDVVARLDARALDRQLAKATFDLAEAEMGFRHKKEQQRFAEEKAAASLQDGIRDNGRTRLRLTRYEEHGKGHDEERERLNKQRTGYRVEDMKDELDQLRKMYDEDELVDATEEIIIKRSERNFTRFKSDVDLSNRIREFNKLVTITWRHEDLKRAVELSDASLERLRAKLAREKESRDSGMERARWDLEQQREAFGRLKDDRDRFVVRAPRGGLLIHGAADAAPWGTRLEKGSRIQSRQVFMTVADEKVLELKATISEGDILSVRNGLAVKFIPDADKKLKLLGRLSVAYLPSSRGKDGGNVYKARVSFDKGNQKLRPGFRGKINVVLEEARDAVVIPTAAVVGKENPVVMLRQADGTAKKCPVVLGVSDGENVAIKEGLAEGDVVELKGGGGK